MRARAQVPAEPVHVWIRTEVVPRFGSLNALCHHLSARSSTSLCAWRRFLVRLAHREQIAVWRVDELCVLLGEHVGRFDNLYQDVG
jgi:hypothetical protein